MNATSAHGPAYERRKLRSDQTNRAIGLLFEAVADALHVSQVALADSRGLRLVHCGDEDVCDVLAAYGPLLFKSIDPTTRRRVLDTLLASVEGATPDGVSVRRFSAHDEDLYLCVLGRPGATKEVALNRAIAGARRILTN